MSFVAPADGSFDVIPGDEREQYALRMSRGRPATAEARNAPLRSGKNILRKHVRFRCGPAYFPAWGGYASLFTGAMRCQPLYGN
jgi:hypothetical protein